MLPVLTAISFCGGVCFLHDADEDARQSLVEIRGRHQLRPRVVAPGKVGPQGGDHHIGAADGVRDEVAVKDIGVD